MKIILPNNKVLRGDLIIECYVRNDLVPIPSSIELVTLYDAELEDLLVEGSVIKAGMEEFEYQIIWKELGKEFQGASGSRGHGAIKVIGFLKSVHKLAFKQERAVIKRQALLSDIYRSCGSSAAFRQDLTCESFACLAGHYATEQIAVVLQEEAASIVWNGDDISFIRNRDLANQKPVLSIAQDTTKDLRSGFLERDQVPTYYSTDGGAGHLQAGDVSKTRSTQFRPRTNQRTLHNLTQVLINKKELTSHFQPWVKAGSVFEIAGKNHVVITALHAFTHANHYSRFWLGGLA